MIDGMPLNEFMGHATGDTYSHALDMRIRPAADEVVAAIRNLETVKFAVREEIMSRFPATRSWTYETSWKYNRDALERIWMNFNQLYSYLPKVSGGAA